MQEISHFSNSSKCPRLGEEAGNVSESLAIAPSMPACSTSISIKLVLG